MRLRELSLTFVMTIATACNGAKTGANGGVSTIPTAGSQGGGTSASGGARSAPTAGDQAGGRLANTGGTVTTSGGRPTETAGMPMTGGGTKNASGGALSSGGARSSGGTLSSGGLPNTGGTEAPIQTVALPPPNAPLDYQLGGDYPPPAGVRIVSRDRTGAPADGLYNICYVNGFQTQPGDERFWLDGHPDLILRRDNGQPLIDPDWPDEMMLDISTAQKRQALLEIEADWIAGCADKGFDAIEVDNLDTYSRSGNRVSQDNAVDFIQQLAVLAHARGLAIAQKNSAELLPRQAEMNTDFAVAEECNTWNECDDFTDAYGDRVLVIEYVRSDFDKGCRDFPQLSIVFRDVALSTPGQSRYLFEGC